MNEGRVVDADGEYQPEVAEVAEEAEVAISASIANVDAHGMLCHVFVFAF